MSDSFNYGPTTTYNSPSSDFGSNWTTTSGTVDYIANGGDYDYICQGTGGCVDLDGSSGLAGVFSTVQSVAAGTYTLALELFGNGRGNLPDDLTITLGNWSTTILGIASADVLTPFFTFTTTGGALSFANAGGDNEGVVLSSVSLAVIPLPAGGLLLFGALGGLALLRRRKTA